MEKFNAPFFGLYENIFIEYSDLHGVNQALQFFEKLFARGLAKAYLATGFSKGNLDHFIKVVKERDESVGLPVSVQIKEQDKIIYQFHQDPFPNLKTIVKKHDLDRTYINFKIRFLLGDEWFYHTTQHIWDGAPFTEHVIYKS